MTELCKDMKKNYFFRSQLLKFICQTLIIFIEIGDFFLILDSYWKTNLEKKNQHWNSVYYKLPHCHY